MLLSRVPGVAKDKKIWIFLVHTVTFSAKELSFCHKLWFSNSYNLATHSLTPFIFRTINSVRSNSLSLKYQRFTPSGCKDIRVSKCKFVAKTQFLWSNPLSSYNEQIYLYIYERMQLHYKDIFRFFIIKISSFTFSCFFFAYRLGPQGVDRNLPMWA